MLYLYHSNEKILAQGYFHKYELHILFMSYSIWIWMS